MFTTIAAKLDLHAALGAASKRNDLLPPREEDRVAGQLAARFVEYLHKQVQDGTYSPVGAAIVQVPKPGFTSRPAALLTLPDRVLYEGMVELLRPRLVKFLISDDVVFWPRATYESKKRWLEFERVPLSDNPKYIVRADVSGFYESIDHQQLEDDLVYATGEREVARAVHRFLSTVMGGRRGLPQGLLPSDTLATTYLQPVDAEAMRTGLRYWRHGDDIRVAANSYSEARRAIALIEHELRKRGLLVNGSKCAILTVEGYHEELAWWEAGVRATKDRLIASAVERLTTDSDELLAAMERADLDEQWGWDLFYHERISVEEVLEQLREHIEPTEIEVSESIFTETVGRAPGVEGGLTKEAFHQRISGSLVRLAAGRSSVAIPHSASLIAKYAEKTEAVCRYLEALIPSHAFEVLAQIENVIRSGIFMTAWQKAWLLRTAAIRASSASAELVHAILTLAQDEEEHWLARTSALKFLGSAGVLEQPLLTRAWKLAPRNYRPDLLSAAARMRPHQPWAARFISAASLDPVERVIAAHADAEAQRNQTL